MPVRHTVIGNPIVSEKIDQAKNLRQHMTPGEKMLWDQLRTNRLCGFHFRRQQVIAGYIVDFYCHEAALVVEVDSKIHETQVESDQERDQILEAKGFSILRIPDEQVKLDMQAVLALILSHLQKKSYLKEEGANG